MRRFLIAILFLAVNFTAGIAFAQPKCTGVAFQNTSFDYLYTSATGALHRVLLKQPDGSYTAFEIETTSPYRVVSSWPNFQKEFTLCPTVPIAPSGSISGMAFVRLASGNYLFVDVSRDRLNAALFDEKLTLISQNQQPCCIVAFGSPVLADLNGDGNPDIIIAQAYGPGSVSAGVSVAVSNGGSSFRPPVLYRIADTQAVTSVVVTDINLDGKVDLVVSTITGKILSLLGNGDGTFQSEQVLITGVNPTTFAVADLNHDGIPDLALYEGKVVNQASLTLMLNANVSVAFGRSSGGFSNLTRYAVASDPGGAITVSDVDGDGNADILTSGLSILFGDGKGGFPRRKDYLAAGEGSQNKQVFDVTQSQSKVIVTDFDGDGRIDIILAYGDAQVVHGLKVTVIFGRGNGEFNAPPLTLVKYPDAPFESPPNDEPTSLAAADFDGDGIADMIVAQPLRISVLKGTGDGRFTLSKQFGLEAVSNTPFITTIAVADFNKDGKLDFAVLAGTPGFSSSISTFLGNGDGTFRAPMSMVTALSSNSLAVGDLNGDGIPDLAVVAGTPLSPFGNSTQVFLGIGDGTFRLTAEVGARQGTDAVIAADIDGNGRLDLIIANSGGTGKDGTVIILSGRGDATFLTSLLLPVSPSPGPSSLLVADFNHDGIPDLGVVTAQGIAVLTGIGNGAFGPAVIFPAGASPSGVLAADWNGDKVLDLIVWPEKAGTGLVYMIGNGDGSFQPPVPFSYSHNSPAGMNDPTRVVAADLNRDGKIDLAVFNQRSLTAFLNISDGPSPLQVVSAASLQNGPLAAESLATVFGANLSPVSAQPNPGDAPLLLGGTRVSVQDSLSVVRAAPLLYVSPLQVNFVVPAVIRSGSAIVTIWNGSNTSQSIRKTIVQTAPSLFTLNANALAAGYLVRVRALGEQSIEPLYKIQNNIPVAIPVDLGSPGDQVYLTLFGTGFRNAAVNHVSVSVKGSTATVTYSGPQGTFPGLDQLNVLLPGSLAGAGDVTVSLEADGASANTVHFTIK